MSTVLICFFEFHIQVASGWSFTSISLWTWASAITLILICDRLTFFDHFLLVANGGDKATFVYVRHVLSHPARWFVRSNCGTRYWRARVLTYLLDELALSIWVLDFKLDAETFLLAYSVTFCRRTIVYSPEYLAAWSYDFLLVIWIK